MIFFKKKKKLFSIKIEAHKLDEVLKCLDSDDLVSFVVAESGTYHVKTYILVYKAEKELVFNAWGNICSA